MGLPSINIIFKTLASSAISRSKKGIVAVIVRDEGVEAGGTVLTSSDQIPAGLSAQNKAYTERAFIGYTEKPRKVLLYVLAAEAGDLSPALAWLATQTFDYLAGPPEITAAEASAVKTWLLARRGEGVAPKAILPSLTADSEAVINFTTAGIKAGGETYTAAQYCSRIAGLLAGTPMTISSTYAVLPEVEDITRLDRAAMDAAIDAGQLILYHDGEKVKVARGVNSLTTVTDAKGEAFKKIKIVEAVDMIQADLRKAAQDSYIGKLANSYDNKCLLVSAVSDYLRQLERDGILEVGSSSVGIDLAAQEAYLVSLGVDTSEMSEQEIKEANTGDKVFLTAVIRILDAIEDINIVITM